MGLDDNGASSTSQHALPCAYRPKASHDWRRSSCMNEQPRKVVKPGGARTRHCSDGNNKPAARVAGGRIFTTARGHNSEAIGRSWTDDAATPWSVATSGHRASELALGRYNSLIVALWRKKKKSALLPSFAVQGLHSGLVRTQDRTQVRKNDGSGSGRGY